MRGKGTAIYLSYWKCRRRHWLYTIKSRGLCRFIWDSGRAENCAWLDKLNLRWSALVQCSDLVSTIIKNHYWWCKAILPSLLNLLKTWKTLMSAACRADANCLRCAHNNCNGVQNSYYSYAFCRTDGAVASHISQQKPTRRQGQRSTIEKIKKENPINIQQLSVLVSLPGVGENPLPACSRNSNLRLGHLTPRSRACHHTRLRSYKGWASA